MCSTACPRRRISSATRCGVMTSRRLPRWIGPDGLSPDAHTIVLPGERRSASAITSSANRVTQSNPVSIPLSSPTPRTRPQRGYVGLVDWDAQRLSFGPAADLYDRVRPRYPIEALRWMLGDQPLHVVDLGAGTGILTRQLLELGHDVLPVEPDAGMRGRLDASVGRELAVEGSAEAIPVADGSVDA